jgi:hypothetical protein
MAVLSLIYSTCGSRQFQESGFQESGFQESGFNKAAANGAAARASTWRRPCPSPTKRHNGLPPA